LDVKALRKLHPEPEVEALLNLLESDGQLTGVPNMGWLASSGLEGLEQSLRDHFGKQASMTTAEFKEITGLSRKGAIPLLEWLDRQLVTTRSGDERIAGSRLGDA
jgi:selenocysteine-specific elongation factor